jgi:hypothetical protein
VKYSLLQLAQKYVISYNSLKKISLKNNTHLPKVGDRIEIDVVNKQAIKEERSFGC